MFNRRTASIFTLVFPLVWLVLLTCSAARSQITINQRYPIRGDKGSNLSAPTLVPTGQCSQHVKVTSFVPGAIIDVYLVATHSGPVAPKKRIGGPVALAVDGMAVNLTQALDSGDQVEATQTVNSVTSGLSLPMTAGSMLSSLPDPTIDGTNIYQCGAVVPVYNLESGVNVSVFDKTSGSSSPIGTGSTPNDWGSTWAPVVTSPLTLGHQIDAQQSACNGAKSGTGPSQPVQASPNPPPEPQVVSAVVGSKAVTVKGLFTGAAVQLFDGSFSTPLTGVGYATESENYFLLSTPLTAADHVLPRQTLCQPSTGTTTYPTSTTIPRPVLLGPICPGSASVTVANSTVNAALVLLLNGAVAGYGGAGLGDVTVNIAAPAVFATGDKVQIVEYFTDPGSPPPVMSNIVVVGCVVHVRQDVANLTAAQMASIERGLKVMMQRSYDNPNDPTGFTYQANMHATLMTGSACPMGDPSNPMWDQCQHYSDLFFPWHRMYLYYFERILRAASGDPNLTLPYWNYESSTEQTLPTAYTTPANPCSQVVTSTMFGLVFQLGNPSATPGCNPLYLPMRTMTAGVAINSTDTDDSTAMADINFEPGPGGFGGGTPPAAECHFDTAQGDLEYSPHDLVHGGVGGIMNYPDQSANDPVFFLHHTEIDHLWKRWIAEGGGRTDPTTDTAWMNQSFSFYDETGNVVTLSVKDVLDTVTQLDYRYDDDPPAGGDGGKSGRRMGEPAPGAQQAAAAPVESLPVTAPKGAELDIKNTREPIDIPAETAARIRQALDGQRHILLALHFDHVKSKGGVVYEIYANLPDGQTPARDSIYYAGNLGFFVDWDGSVVKTLDVTKTIRALQDKHAWKDNRLILTFVPRGDLNAQTKEPLPLEPGVRAVLEEVGLGAR
jgi:hypothetical protein